MDTDDIAYRKSVRNMMLVLAAIAITIFAAIFIPPYVNPPHDVFQTSVSLGSPFGFTMHLTLNSTTMAPDSGVVLTGWVNSSSNSIQNVTSADSWALPQSELWGGQCASGWPMGLGVMMGHYTQDNYTLGTLLPLTQPSSGCTALGSPSFFLFYPLSSKALAGIGVSPTLWIIQTRFSFSEGSLQPNAIAGAPGVSGLPPGVYTAVMADEWGDVLTANFLVI
jgi:hypothetical protein